MENTVPRPERRSPLEQPVERLVAPLSEFARSQVACGILLILALSAALFMANSAYADLYNTLQHEHLAISFGSWSVDMSLKHWMNDALMVLFFFLLGLEIKRELLAGELREPGRSRLVFCMALGGMLVPAGVYLGIVMATGGDAARGWGIPIATDAAFALGILAALGGRVPPIAIVLMSALAILDDIGAVLVISVFYTEQILPTPLGYAALSLAALCLLNLAGVRRAIPYLIVAVALWWWVLQSGVHATTAGVLAALAVPARPYADKRWFMTQIPKIWRRFRRVDEPRKSILEQHEQHDLLKETQRVSRETSTPLQRWETSLEKPVMLGVIPVFAFLNAGINLEGSIAVILSSTVTFAIAVALLAGKAVGISVFAWLGVRLGFAELPESLDFAHIVGLGCLAGIGFTMSLFISALAFDVPLIAEQAKIGILLGSLLAALAGTGVLLWRSSRAA